MIQRGQIIKDGIGVKPTVSITSFSRGRTDPILNIHFKSFFFVYRQAINSSLKIMFLIRNEIQKSKGVYEILDASKSGKFSIFFENLKTGKFSHYDERIINFLDSNSDMLILPRVIRNQIKEMGTIPVNIINEDQFNFIIFIPRRAKKDKSFQYISALRNKDSTIPENLTITPDFINLCFLFMTDFFNNLCSECIKIYNIELTKVKMGV